MSGWATPLIPNEADYLLFLQGIGMNTSVLPVNSPWIGYAFNQAMSLVNPYCSQGSQSFCAPPLGAPIAIQYTLAVYNCAAHIQIQITPDQTASVVGTIAGNVLDVTAVNSGIILPGMAVQGLTSSELPLSILSYGTGTGGIGDYTLNQSLTVSSATINLTATYFSTLRGPPPGGFNINGFVAGVVTESHDETTGQTLTVSDAFKNLTIGDLNFITTPWGRKYLAYAQDYGEIYALS